MAEYSLLPVYIILGLMIIGACFRIVRDKEIISTPKVRRIGGLITLFLSFWAVYAILTLGV